MSIKHFGKMVRQLKTRKSKASRSFKHRQVRRLMSESLETRQLLAGDLVATPLRSHHNYLAAEDVNADFKITPTDALIVLNEIAKQGAGELNPGNLAAEHFTDVNADGSLTPLDALVVINRLTRGEGELDPMLSLELDVTQDGVSILEPGTRNFEVVVGERFDLEVKYNDLRDAFNQFGVFSLYVDILATGIDAFRPVLSETQILELSEELENVSSGSLRLSFDNAPNVTVDIPTFSADSTVPTLTNRPEVAIKNAIEQGLGRGPNSVSVSQLTRSANSTNQQDEQGPFQYVIRFVGETDSFTDIPNLIVDTSSLTGATVTGSVFEVPVFSNVDGTQINPNALLYNVDYRSSTLNDRIVYNDVRSGAYNPGNVETFNEVGAVGPAAAGGLRGEEGFDGTNVEAFSIQLEAVRAQDNVTFTLDLPDNPIGSEISLYGASETADLALTSEMIVIDLTDDPGENGDDRPGLVVGKFVIEAEPVITAVLDTLTIQEDADEVMIDVLANDLPDDGTLTVQSVGVAANGLARLENGQVFYEPFADYYGNDTFTYQITNGVDIATGRVTVAIGSVNDPPTGNPITVSVRRDSTLGIPYRSFLNQQPDNEERGITILSAEAVDGTVSFATGNNLLYQPDADGDDVDTIEVVFSDNDGAQGSVIITVDILDAAVPTANPDTIELNEDTPTTFSNDTALLANDSVLAGTKQVARFDTTQTLGTLQPNANGTFTYTPPANLFGVAADRFSYVMTDGVEDSQPALVTINLLNLNDQPTADNVTLELVVPPITSTTTIDLSEFITAGLGETAGQDGQTVQITGVSGGTLGGELNLTGNPLQLQYTSFGDQGTDTFTYTVTDQGGLTDTGTINLILTVTGVGGTASISGVKFDDANDNNQRDTGEGTLPGWTIYLDLNNNGTLDGGEPTTVTDANGAYLFENLTAGDYVVREVEQSGWRQTFPLMTTTQAMVVETGDYAGFVTTADVDSDGDIDILVANEYDRSTDRTSNISLLINDGANGYSEITLALPSDSRPQAIVADQDVTGDGIADIVVASAGAFNSSSGNTSNGLHLFAGAATGFSSSAVPQFIRTGNGPSDLVVRDLNGDGVADIVVANHRSNDVRVLISNGNGNFSASQTLPSGDEPVALAMGQTATGGQIMAVANYESGTVSIFTRTSSSFVPSPVIMGFVAPTDVELADLNGDGNDDLIVTDSSTNVVRVLPGNGAGGFGIGTSTSVISKGRSAPEAIAIVDADRDGLPDIMIANRQGGESLLLNNGNGTFRDDPSRPLAPIPNFSPALAKSIAVANLDGDNNFDYVIAYAAEGISIHTNGVSNAPGFHAIDLQNGEAATGNDFGNFQFGTPVNATVTLSASRVAITESGTNNSSVVSVNLSQAVPQNVVVNLGLGGTATRNLDYSLGSLQFTIPAGQTSGSATITSLPDTLDEGVSETIVVSIETVTGATESGQQQQTITLLDDDDPLLPTVQLQATPLVLSEGQSATLTAVLSAPAAQQVVVTLDYATGSAVRGTDFTAPLQLVIAAGQNSASATIEALTDSQDELDEAIIATIASVSGATELGVQSRTINILGSSTAPPVVTLTQSATSMDEVGGFVVFTATMSSLSDTDVIVDLAFPATSTAVRNADYIAPAQIVISAGTLTGAISANSVDDLLDDDGEQFSVQIFEVTGATAANTNPLTVTIIDNDAPTVTLTSDLATITEDGGIARLTAELSSPVNVDTVVALEYGGTAQLGRDFTAQSNRIIIPAGQTSGSILLQAINNSIIEDENRLILVSVVNSTATTTITIRNEDGTFFPLKAIGTPTEGFGSEATEEDVAMLYAASLNIWRQAGLSEAGLQKLREVDVVIDDLEGDTLGLGEIDTIMIDVDAAGFGWFIDATPEESSEFNAFYFSDAAVTMDLLSLILHEQGHILGLPESSSELMMERLAVGTRRMPSSADVDAALNALFND
ncbi:MAG: FG-GAP-like repeat-containing protein [Pirellulaceae bacterium]